MTNSELRLIASRGGWWALNSTHAARLPHHAVQRVGNEPCDLVGLDRERGLALTEDALAALELGGFFTVTPSDNFAVTVLTATACNLGCNYCFQNTSLAAPGSHAPPRIKAAVLDSAQISASVAFIARQMTAAELTSTSVLLFGGEPLLNVLGCVGLLCALTPLNLVDAEIVTNGVLLTPRTARNLRRAGLRRVQVTFDGDRVAHDRVRVTRNGRPTYDNILRNVRASSAAVPDLAWNFRVNVSHHNLETLFNLVEDLAHAVHDARQVTMHLALIDDNGLGYENAVGYDPALTATFIAVNAAAIRAGMQVPPSRPLTVCPYCSVAGGERGAVINADGTLYSAGRTLAALDGTSGTSSQVTWTRQRCRPVGWPATLT